MYWSEHDDGYMCSTTFTGNTAYHTVVRVSDIDISIYIDKSVYGLENEILYKGTPPQLDKLFLHIKTSRAKQAEIEDRRRADAKIKAEIERKKYLEDWLKS